MTSARRTPRYVGVIGSEPMGPQLMGPHPLPGPQPLATVPTATPPRRGGTAVLPLHPPTHPRYTPQVEHPAPAPAPVVEPASVASERRRRVVPVARRPLQVLIISTAPGSAPRRFEVARWQARTMVAALAVMGTLACGFVASVVVAVRSPELFGESSELQGLRSELVAARDSLAVARAALDDSSATDSGDDEEATPAAPAAAATPAPAVKHEAPAARPHLKPLSARRRPTADDADEHHTLGLIPRSLADLPVIGALASGFSLARRHPLLHRVRPHLGVDLAAPRGTRVSAPAPGRVSFVGRKLGFGLVVELDHGDGVTTRYAHLRSSAVQTGEHVTRGEAIAAVGTSGITTGPHLHYEILVHGKQVDPLRFRFTQEEPAAGPVAASPAPASPAVGAASAPAAVMGAHEGASSTLPAPPR